MESEIVESVHHAVVPAECVDEYYPSEKTNKIVCFPSTVENRFRTDLPALNFGSTSTVVFNPTEGLQDIILTATLPAPTDANSYLNWALPRGWLSQFIRSVGIRIGGSSLYYFTGDQLEIANFQDCEDGQKKDALFQLAGSEILNQAGFASEAARTASIYIKCPWNSVSALQKPLPLPTDLLTQPVQLLIETNPATQVFYNINNAGLTSDLPSAFASAQIQYKQVHMNDAGHQLARTHNMNEEALTYPLPYFQQTTFRTTVSNVVANQDVQLNLTGFRAGSVKNINMWAIQLKDGSGNAVNRPGNNRNYTQIGSVRITVNGLVYYDTTKYSNQLWDLCELKVPGYFSNTVLTSAPGPVSTAVATPVATPWTRIPFAQVAQAMANETNTTLGLAIANSVVNATVQFPADGTYELSFSYEYVSELLFTRGSAEYIF
jgi:hypothetical protein